MKKLGNISNFNLDKQEDKSFNDLDNISICFSEGIRKVVEMNLNNYKNKISKYLNGTSKIELLEPKEITVVISKGYPDYLMSVEEASKRLKVDKNLVYDLVKYGLIAWIDTGAIKISSYELDDFITRNQGKNIKEMLREMKELREGVI
ncbi:helix-turn-helix domain-containing protein [Clostridioides difficile]|nr:helix-turn-helix domain-containing protein [uncultured Clostridioides sp.]EGT5419651.1 DNA-binding protein [Clostridioides difficile]EKS6799637.1 helix-turn-helix domain-containing protein [Clostridioides difficile]MBH7490174.1 helix-turn-helix domain-containing protein [Clostridioides difficile]MBY1671510.1 helix-turn-helix domain-containing protein [Clostridioides difficile]MBY1795150.1 helix-turn-helix domain-containing protein [Clostridioides difficile]